MPATQYRALLAHPLRALHDTRITIRLDRAIPIAIWAALIIGPHPFHTAPKAAPKAAPRVAAAKAAPARTSPEPRTAEEIYNEMAEDSGFGLEKLGLTRTHMEANLLQLRESARDVLGMGLNAMGSAGEGFQGNLGDALEKLALPEIAKVLPSASVAQAVPVPAVQQHGLFPDSAYFPPQPPTTSALPIPVGSTADLTKIAKMVGNADGAMTGLLKPAIKSLK